MRNIYYNPTAKMKNWEIMKKMTVYSKISVKKTNKKYATHTIPQYVAVSTTNFLMSISVPSDHCIILFSS